MLRLNTIKAQPGSTKNKKRLGRGSGSGHGPTAGKGDKGQLARSGGSVRPGFEGGQMPLYRRIPKRGFTSLDRSSDFTLNLADLDRLSGIAAEVSLESLRSAGVLRGKYDRLVVLGNGKVTKPLKIRANKVSASAKRAIELVGGAIALIETTA